MKELKTELIDARNKSRELALRNERARNYSYDVYTRKETKSIIYAVIFMIALMIVLGKFSSISTDRLENANFNNIKASVRTETPYTEIHRYDYGVSYDNGNIIVTSDGNEWEVEDVKIPTNAEVKVKFYTNLTESIYDDEIRDVEVIER